MNVRDFKELIKHIPPEFDNFEVVMSKDPEGNSFHVFYELDYQQISGKSGKYYDPHSNEICSYNADDYNTEDEFFERVNSYDQLQPCIILWP